MEHLKEIIAEYAVPQAILECKVEELTQKVESLETTVSDLRRLCEDLQQGYDVSDSSYGHVAD